MRKGGNSEEQQLNKILSFWFLKLMYWLPNLHILWDKDAYRDDKDKINLVI